MGKKHKRNMSPEELANHEIAVRLRRMSDRQLVEALQRSPATNAPAAAPLDTDPQAQELSPVEILLQELSAGRCKGVGKVTTGKVSQFAVALGLLK